jgi:ABC-type transporter Mla MlaB component
MTIVEFNKTFSMPQDVKELNRTQLAYDAFNTISDLREWLDKEKKQSVMITVQDVQDKIDELLKDYGIQELV